jgi:hypothetical protein
MKKLLPVTFFFIYIAGSLSAQPYVDLVSLQGLYSNPDNIMGEKPFDAQVRWRSIQATAPYQFKDSSAFIAAPGYDRWTICSPPATVKLITAYLPLTYFRLLSAHSRIAAVIIPRFNSADELKFSKNTFQCGGAVVYTWRKNLSFALKAGLYYNKEFFGNYFLPLVGIDWKASDRLFIFGIIPNNLFIDYKLHEKIHGGFAYKGITSSFRFKTGSSLDYFSVEEGQLKLFFDFYVTKKMVINIEGGHSVARKSGVGMLDKNVSEINYNDGYILKAGLNYRLWLK